MKKWYHITMIVVDLLVMAMCVISWVSRSTA